MKIGSQATIIVGPAFGARHWPQVVHSKLYDPEFGHHFRCTEPKREEA